MGSHVRELLKNAGNIWQLQATDVNGLPAYYFIAVKPEKKKIFETAITAGNIDLAAYGEILLSGYGVPGAMQKDFMLDHFDFEMQPIL